MRGDGDDMVPARVDSLKVLKAPSGTMDMEMSLRNCAEASAELAVMTLPNLRARNTLCDRVNDIAFAIEKLVY